ncbi:MAG: hypothetical protein FJW22_12240 [Acidimicrobiia bacterium]|nr:hypothetical protein [Acidimicrobiia bacterium]
MSGPLMRARRTIVGEIFVVVAIDPGRPCYRSRHWDEVAGDCPPSRSGLRGDREGSFEWTQGMREGVFPPGGAINGRETCELIIVGGISGLAASQAILAAQTPPEGAPFGAGS